MKESLDYEWPFIVRHEEVLDKGLKSLNMLRDRMEYFNYFSI